MVCLGLILVLCVCVRVCEVCGVGVCVVILQQDHTYATAWVRVSKSEMADRRRLVSARDGTAALKWASDTSSPWLRS
jgi:hypothetical protein